jgi:hypothetical protein
LVVLAGSGDQTRTQNRHHAPFRITQTDAFHLSHQGGFASLDAAASQHVQGYQKDID